MSNPTQTPPPAPAKVHKLEDEETPRRSDMDITGLKDFDSISQIFPQKQGVWLWGSIQAGLIHATEEMENPENIHLDLRKILETLKLRYERANVLFRKDYSRSDLGPEAHKSQGKFEALIEEIKGLELMANNRKR
ncbi:hypothetical protein M430DRAFT_35659 [Amorphotheca resinae ATCC 22711]|uniref:Uncharacterized protein n=1 Tax=Amorphotheca resinae ATCC 22711 TaxID=857342 RepID=A0A2T3B129_AMORE|nr:hypothetical protein M430DRAFT_35659 [Amorphotheca resinae ATCC 22711]PSS17107.1 hypothetical protein M430DRAFT_35659 [Amorphotheca resinae ATCC 22711]